MNKRGQFYIVGAIMIILTLSALVSIKTYAIIRPEPRQIKDIATELKEEGPRIVEYEIFNNIPRLEEFLEKNFSIYFLKKTENTSIVFVYGNLSNPMALQYVPEVTGTISAIVGENSLNWQQENFYVNKTSFDVSPDNIIDINLSGKEFKIQLPSLDKQRLFYFIIVQQKEREGEVYVAKN